MCACVWFGGCYNCTLHLYNRTLLRIFDCVLCFLCFQNWRKIETFSATFFVVSLTSSFKVLKLLVWHRRRRSGANNGATDHHSTNNDIGDRRDTAWRDNVDTPDANKCGRFCFEVLDWTLIPFLISFFFKVTPWICFRYVVGLALRSFLMKLCAFSSWVATHRSSPQQVLLGP